MASSMAAVLLVIGLVVGAGIGYAAVSASSGNHTVTSTITNTSTVTGGSGGGLTTVTTTVGSGSGGGGVSTVTQTLVSTATQTVSGGGGGGGAKTYTIGVVFPLTSSLAAFGKSFVQAVNLSLTEINTNLSNSGSQTRFKMVVADDQGTPSGALAAVTNLYTTDNVHVVIGPLTTAEVQGALQYAQTNHILLLPPASSGTALNIPVFGSPDSYLIRPGQPGDQFESNALAQTVNDFGIKYAAFLYSSDTSEAGTYNLTSSLLQADGVKTSGVEIQPLQSDYSGAVSTLSTNVQSFMSSGGTANNTAVILCEHGTDAQNIMTHAASDATLSGVRWFGIEALNDNLLLNDTTVAPFMAKVQLTITTLYTPNSPQGTAFLSNFQQTFGAPPEPFSNYAYDVANIAGLSILTAGTDNATALLPIVLVVSDHYFGASGTPSYVDPKTGSQSIAYFAVDKEVQNGTVYTFSQIGLYDGATNLVTLTSK